MKRFNKIKSFAQELTDLQKAVFSDQNVLEFQKFMKSGPLGVSYNGPQDGFINDRLIASLQNLENKLGIQGKIVSNVNINVAINDLKKLITNKQQTQQKQEQQKQQPQPGAGSAKNQQGQKIIEFKQYFAEVYGSWPGDINDPTADATFVKVVQAFEDRLSSMLQQISPEVGPNRFKGMIWQNGQLNPKTSPKDLERTLGLLLKQLMLMKKGQATVDTFDVEEYQENQPIAVKPMPDKEDHGGDGTVEDDPVADPANSQYAGRFQQILPKDKIQKKMPVVGMDDRIASLAKIKYGIC